MISADDIKKYFSNASLNTNKDADERIIKQLVQAHSKASKDKQLQPDTNIWRLIMNNRITKLTAAAVILIAVIAGIYFSGGNVDFTSPAFADVMENIYKAQNVIYTEVVVTPKYTFTNTKLTDTSGVLRIESEDHDFFMLFDHYNGLSITAYPNIKKCYIHHRVGRKRSSKPFMWLNFVSKMHHNPAQYSHSEILDGNDVDVYIIDVPYETTIIWVDPQTDLPVKILIERFPNTEISNIVEPHYSLNKKDFGGTTGESASGCITSGRGSGLGISKKTTQTLTNFIWDSDLDPNLFTFEPPDDWYVEEKQFKDKEIAKNDLINALSFWTEMSDGNFPDKINDLMDPNKLNPKLIEKYNTGGDPNEQFDQARAEAITAIRGLYFAQEKKVADNWNYAGKGLKFGDNDTPVAWWQNDEEDTWTIIYADLSIDETATEPPN